MLADPRVARRDKGAGGGVQGTGARGPTKAKLEVKEIRGTRQGVAAGISDRERRKMEQRRKNKAVVRIKKERTKGEATLEREVRV